VLVFYSQVLGLALESNVFVNNQGANYKKILRLSYDVIITYDNRKLLSHRKIILRFFCN